MRKSQSRGYHICLIFASPPMYDVGDAPRAQPHTAWRRPVAPDYDASLITAGVSASDRGAQQHLARLGGRVSREFGGDAVRARGAHCSLASCTGPLPREPSHRNVSRHKWTGSVARPHSSRIHAATGTPSNKNGSTSYLGGSRSIRSATPQLIYRCARKT